MTNNMLDLQNRKNVKNTGQEKSDAQDTLLGPNDPPPFTVLNEAGKAKCLLLCDHAGLAVPEKLNRLGLDDEHYTKHYAYDIGVKYITERLSETLDAPALLANYSRMVVDVNRHIDHPTAFVKMGEGVPIPGNRNMSGEDRQMRTREIYAPYHEKVDSMIRSFLDRDVIPVILSIHSYTPVFFKQERPWEFAVLWMRDPRMPEKLIEFYRNKGFDVGNNQPYDGRISRGSTVNVHADSRGLPNALIEVRQDLIDTDEKGEIWVRSLTEIMSRILGDETIHSIYDGPMPDYDPEKELRYYDEVVERAKRGEL